MDSHQSCSFSSTGKLQIEAFQSRVLVRVEKQLQWVKTVKERLHEVKTNGIFQTL